MFSDNVAEPGFRLHRLEVYNWGTFHGQVYSMIPGGQNAVLAGINGSGKSTLVDALVTLLVPNRERSYNMASGATSRRERNERSYVRGAYSQVYNELAQSGESRYLRGADSYSVLLAVFKNYSTGQAVSIAQLLRDKSDGIAKDFYVADKELSIEQHFSNLENLKRRLRGIGVDAYSSFEEYRQQFVRFGISSKQAIDAFNKTISVKEIESLNKFIRTTMLEAYNVRDDIESLQAQYQDLTTAYKAIQRAKAQLDILTPLVDTAKQFHENALAISDHELAIQLAPAYVAEQSQTLLEQAIHELEKQLSHKQTEQTSLEAKLEELQETARQIQNAIASDEVGQRLQAIGAELRHIEANLQRTRAKAQEYNRLSNLLGLESYSSLETFADNLQQVDIQRGNVQIERTDLDTQRVQAEIDKKTLEQKCITLEAELDYFRNNLSQIPPRIAGIREMLIGALDIPIEELPFVGELLRVPEEEREWEGTLERLLRSFALELLVPDRYYEQVSRYVDKQHLGERLVYRRIKPEDLVASKQTTIQTSEPPFAYTKVEIRGDTPFYSWLERQLISQFDYKCCETLDKFTQANRAITLQGQIKHSHTRHEKDDRHNLLDRGRYVLGWDNQQKITALEIELEQIVAQISRATKQVKDFERYLDGLREREITLASFAQFQDYYEIDWRTHQHKKDELAREQQALTEKSDRLLSLRNQQADTERQIKSVGEHRVRLIRESDRVEQEIQRYQERLIASQELLNQTSANWDDQKDRAFVILHAVGLSNELLMDVNAAEKALDRSLKGSLAHFTGRQRDYESVLIGRMVEFITRFPEDSFDLHSSLASLSDFERKHEDILEHRLPEHEIRFKEFLNDSMATSIANFRQKLEQRALDIRKRIEELNISLWSIEYSTTTRIRLTVSDANNNEVRDFRRELRNCLPDIGQQQDHYRAFENIQRLIEKFGNEPNWGERVADTRIWLTFAAEEVRLSDGSIQDHYTDSSGKSGGQKAKLAYTILAAALAYQYDIRNDYNGLLGNSFRFVVIDEAFSKLDDQNAHYAMELFKALGLQLLVVTPMDKLHVIEQHVRAYHLVWNNNEGNNSQVANLSAIEYERRKSDFALVN